jgi:hypothetical protein
MTWVKTLPHSDKLFKNIVDKCHAFRDDKITARNFFLKNFAIHVQNWSAWPLSFFSVMLSLPKHLSIVMQTGMLDFPTGSKFERHRKSYIKSNLSRPDPSTSLRMTKKVWVGGSSAKREVHPRGVFNIYKNVVGQSFGYAQDRLSPAARTTHPPNLLAVMLSGAKNRHSSVSS